MPEKSNRKEEILRMALHEFTREGYSGARLQSIADQTGVTKAMIHYYFKTKENLFRETFDAVCNELMNDLFSPLEKKHSLYSKIEDFTDKVITRFERQPVKAQFLVSELNRYPDTTLQVLREHYKCDLSVLNRQLKEASESYEIAPVSSDQLIANVLSLCIFSYSGQAFLQEVLDKDDDSFEMFLEQRREVIKDTIMNWLTG